MARIGPVILEIAGDRYLGGGRVSELLWVGTGTLGDVLTLAHEGDGILMWESIALDSNLYQGISFGPKGVSFEQGLHLTRNDSASSKLLIYLLEI